MKRVPYCYLIGWSKYNKWYYGCQYGKNANPKNLWKTYFTSSNTVKEFRKKFGEPDIVQIRKTFSSSLSTTLWEHKVLRRLQAPHNPKWINKTDNKAIVNDDESRKLIAKKISESLKGKKKTKKHKENISKSRKENPIKWTNEMRKRQSHYASNMSEKSLEKRSNTLSKLIWVNDGKNNFRVDRNLTHQFNLGRIYNPPNRDQTIYRFISDIYGEFIGTRHELQQKFPLCDLCPSALGLLIRGKYKSHRGWKIMK
tara:strand:+ start:117 stop:881 length:765 start_codon:yes stop_codon:yes gene_type:complete